MVDLTSSKLLILAIVAVIVVAPKDLPVLLRTVGNYLGVMRRHATAFRARFDEVLREVELHDLKKEIEGVGNEMLSVIDQGSAAIDEHVITARSGVSRARGSTLQRPSALMSYPYTVDFSAKALTLPKTPGLGLVAVELLHSTHPLEFGRCLARCFSVRSLPQFLR